MEPLAVYLAPKGGVPGIGPEKGRVVEDGIAAYKDPYGSTRYVFYISGVPVAALQVVSRDKKHAIIANVYTLPAYRRQGFAANLLRKARQDFVEVKHAHESMLSLEGKAFSASVRDPAVRRDYRSAFSRASPKIQRGAPGEIPALSARQAPHGKAGMILSEKDKRVIRLFTDAQGSALQDIGFIVDGGVFSSKHLSTDGRRLDINGLGGRGVAEWRNGHIAFGETGGKNQESVHRYLRKITPRNWLVPEDRPGSRRDPAPSKPKKERYRMPYKHVTRFHRLGEGIVGHFKGSEGHLASAEGWREQATKMEDPKRRKEFLAHARAHEKRAASKGMQTSHRRVLEGELWKIWPKEYKFIPPSARQVPGRPRGTAGSRRTIRMKTREGYEDKELRELTDEEIMHLLHPARRDPMVPRDYRPAVRRRIPSKSETSGKALKHLPKDSLLHAFNKKVASSSRRGALRDASPRPSVLITRKKYKSKNGVKVKKTKYRIKSRDPAVPRDYRPAVRRDFTKGRSAWKVGIKESRSIEEHAFSIYGDAVKFVTAARNRGESIVYGPIRMSEGEVAGVPGWSRARGIRGLHASQTVSIGNKYP